MPAPYQGECLCGAIRFRLTDEPLTVYACHCTDCQRRTGSAFALSMVVKRRALELLRGQTLAYNATLPDGRHKAGQLCARCGTRLWGEPAYRAVVVVQPGVLDQPCGLAPVAHLWARSAQPWMVFADDAVRFDTQPAEPAALLALWAERGMAQPAGRTGGGVGAAMASPPGPAG